VSFRSIFGSQIRGEPSKLKATAGFRKIGVAPSPMPFGQSTLGDFSLTSLFSQFFERKTGSNSIAWDRSKASNSEATSSTRKTAPRRSSSRSK
jgi:hypothetical protein